ncbi:MAG: DUF542 domain-containing protein [Brumimicrobium sp.]|nr:DUF542 domain-containing protein [Brumimicrobium sp.]
METVEKILDATKLSPMIKHQTILQTFEDLAEGDYFILQNDHDPKPLYYQFSSVFGDTFTWDYLQQGPSIFQIKIEKKGLGNQEKVVDATKLAPAIKHQTIFQTYEDLAEGEYFILQNDHDPKPLYYQLSSMKGDTFTWEYLQNGPTFYEIKITKKGDTPTTEEETSDELVVDAPLLHPSIKHQMIIQTFEELEEGKSFILRNDHDPKPLKYQLESLKGNIFDWVYLQEGPELFEIRITKKKAGENSNEEILDATKLSPAIKHKTIIETFDNLKEGESFILHNDHDPKPLYYQLSATKGDTFTWDYLQQGPSVFEIRITKKSNTNTNTASSASTTPLKRSRIKISFDGVKETVRTMVAKDYRLIQVFEKHDVDCFWHANKTLSESCKEAGVEKEQIEKEIQEVQHNVKPLLMSQDYNLWDVEFLADYILETHHRYVRENAEIISGLADNVAQRHGQHHPELKELASQVKLMFKDFLTHMSKEEDVLFPAIRKMAQLLSEGKKPEATGGAFANAVAKMEAEHDETGDALRNFRKITNNYTLPNDACDSYSFFFKKLEEFEHDTYLHVHLENNILFPKAIILENKIGK